jgi:hypothetical protein
VIFAIISGFPTAFPKKGVRQGLIEESVEKTADMDEYIP